ncbi:glutathione hydrolase [Acrasis kona]|uniref:Glutathione hydrolase n=1 Tax=Acrasis kona TaxID=1008807 RepID=A0AAW2ZKU4_9EUKA
MQDDDDAPKSPFGRVYSGSNDAAYDSDQSDIEYGEHIINKYGTNNKKYLYHFGIPVIIIVLLIFGSIIGIIVSNSVATIPQTSKKGSEGAVAADDPVCSEMGLKILKRGGNAVDAAVTTALCLGVMRPYASGIGGGGFLMKSQNGGLAVAVPAEPAGLYAAHSKYGKLSWKELFQDPIAIARDGFVVDELMEIRIKNFMENIKNNPGLSGFLTRNGVPLKRGDVMKRPEYSQLLQRLANEGVDPFYKGDIASKMVNEIKNAGGIITDSDFANYKPIWRYSVDDATPASQYSMVNFTSFYNNGRYRVVAGPPPCSGSALIMMLNILDKLNFRDAKMNYGLQYHLVVESLKHGFANRMGLGDLPFLPSDNVTAVMNKLLNPAVAAKISSWRIDPGRTFPWPYYFQDPATFDSSKDSGTTHLSVIDKDRNGVSLTTTVNTIFGSGVVSPAFGLVYNNQMDDFSVQKEGVNLFGLPPSLSNRIAPGKRPLSSQTPTMVFDTQQNNRLVLVVGASGGPTILSSVLQVLVDILDLNLDPQVAINLPRVHVQAGVDEVAMEEGLIMMLQKALIEKGHKLKIAPILPDGHTIGSVQAVQVTNDGKTLVAASDIRKLGVPATF